MILILCILWYNLAEKYYLLAVENGNFYAPRHLGDFYETQNKFEPAEKYYKTYLTSAIVYYFLYINKVVYF